MTYQSMNLPANAQGRTFKDFRGNSYTVVGLSKTDRRYPVLARAYNGRKVKFSALQVAATMVSA